MSFQFAGLLRPDEFWTSIPQRPEYDFLLSAVKAYYQEFYDPIPSPLLYTDRHLTYENGSRTEFETPYFKRRNFLSAAVILSLIYPEEEHYLTEVKNQIWAILEEYCWAVPAHTQDLIEDNDSFVDLFAAETSCMLAEISCVLGERLPLIFHQRIRREVHQRLTVGLRRTDFHWLTVTNNWAAVCAGASGIALMYLDPEGFQEHLPRLLSCMEHFLSGYPEDGTCMEGTAYWEYGFGFFLFFADMYRRYTAGQVDLLEDPKIEKIAQYMQGNFLTGDAMVSFSDGDRNAYHSADYGMQHYLHQRYPESVFLLPEKFSKVSLLNTGWAYLYRNFLFVDPLEQKNVTELTLKDRMLSGARQVFLHRRGYSLVAKAGHNGESHNHNDVGSILVSTTDGQTLADLGCGLYSMNYFSSYTRYTYLCNHSFGHNVPIINGQGQKTGEEYSGSICYSGENEIQIRMEKAYGIPELEKLERVIRAEDGVLYLQDRWEGEPETFTERLVSFNEPVFSTSSGEEVSFMSLAHKAKADKEINVEAYSLGLDGTILETEGLRASDYSSLRLGKLILEMDESIREIRISTGIHLHHGFNGGYDRVYLLDFSADPEKKQTEICFRISG